MTELSCQRCCQSKGRIASSNHSVIITQKVSEISQTAKYSRISLKLVQRVSADNEQAESERDKIVV